MDDLKWDFNVAYDEKDAVGRRYRRQDAVGTPFCITVDHQTLSGPNCNIEIPRLHEQNSGGINELSSIISKEVSINDWLKKM